MRFLISIVLCILSQLTIGQIAFHKFFTNNGYDYGHGIVQLEDSSYVICGSSSSFTDGPSQAFLLHIDSAGNYLWSNHYGGTESDVARRVGYIPGEGFISAGYTNSSGNGAYDAYAFRTDISGNLLWETTIGGAGWERINDAVLLKDTGMLMVGQSNSTVNGDNDMYIVRISSSGDTIWTKKMGSLGEDAANAVVALTDSTFAIGGEYFIADSNHVKGYLFAIHIDGTVLWYDTIQTIGASSIIDLDVDLAANRIHLVGWKFNDQAGKHNNLFGKYLPNGTPDFFASEPTTDYKWVDQITRYGSQGKNYMAYRYIDPTSFQDGTDITVSILMSNLYWDGIVHNINYPLDDVPGQLIPTSDGGAILVGSSSGMGIGGANVFVMKIGPNNLFPIMDPDPFPNSLVQLVELNEVTVNVYPNPANELLNIRVSEEQNLDLELVDLNGKLLKQLNVYGNSSIDLSDLDAGIYLLYLRDQKNSNSNVIRIVKN